MLNIEGMRDGCTGEEQAFPQPFPKSSVVVLVVVALQPVKSFSIGEASHHRDSNAGRDVDPDGISRIVKQLNLSVRCISSPSTRMHQTSAASVTSSHGDQLWDFCDTIDTLFYLRDVRCRPSELWYKGSRLLGLPSSAAPFSLVHDGCDVTAVITPHNPIITR